MTVRIHIVTAVFVLAQSSAFVQSSSQDFKCYETTEACQGDHPMFLDWSGCEKHCQREGAARKQSNAAHYCAQQSQCCCYYARHSNGIPNDEETRKNEKSKSKKVPEEDRVRKLPGADFRVPFDIFSGYLEGNEEGTYHMHYMLDTSQLDPTQDPVLFWFNGGPGCSSLSGMFFELGPLRANVNGSSLHLNPWAWNQVTNLVAIESPPGVGYSYTEDFRTKWNDTEVAELNARAIVNFFLKFPLLADLDFYISGESYAGVYIPTMAKRIIELLAEGNFPNKNFKGIAIGNGFLDSEILTNTEVPLLYYHGLLGMDQYKAITRDCCADKCAEECDFAKHMVPSPDAAANYISDGTSCGQKEYENNLSTDAENGFACIDEAATTNYLNRKDVQQALHVSELWMDEIGKWEECSNVFYEYTQTVFTSAPLIEYLLSQQVAPLRALIYAGDVDTVCNFIGVGVFTHQVADKLNAEKSTNRTVWTHRGAQAGAYESWNENQLTLLTVAGAGHMVPTDRPGPALQMITNFITNATDYSRPIVLNALP